MSECVGVREKKRKRELIVKLNINILTPVARLPETISLDSLSWRSLTPTILMYSFSRTSFSRTIALTVMATGNNHANSIATGNTNSIATTKLHVCGGQNTTILR